MQKENLKNKFRKRKQSKTKNLEEAKRFRNEGHLLGILKEHQVGFAISASFSIAENTQKLFHAKQESSLETNI